MLFQIIFLICGLLAPPTPPPGLVPEELPEIREPGFLPLRIIDYTPNEKWGTLTDPDQQEVGVWIIDKDRNVLGWFKRGQHLPGHFADWRVVDFRRRGGNLKGVMVVIFTNTRSKQTIEIALAPRNPEPRRDGSVADTQPTTRPSSK